MNQAQHRKLRAAGWHYDPLSLRYSAPGVALDGKQKMFTQAEAWEKEQAAKAKEAEKDDRPV